MKFPLCAIAFVLGLYILGAAIDGPTESDAAAAVALDKADAINMARVAAKEQP